jgi:DNA repair protein RecN (Recombination protein N)
MPLAKVASGGELSRILLSLKEYVAAQSTSVGVYLFDEVDTGIGGETAHIVGKKLAVLAKSSQVLVVTHLAQIAAFATEQVLVEKKHGSESSKTELRILSKTERLNELARMLGGQKLDSAKKLAEDLVKRVRAELSA